MKELKPISLLNLIPEFLNLLAKRLFLEEDIVTILSTIQFVRA
jgi:hypothetical protein